MRPKKPDGTNWNPIDSNKMLQHFHRQTRDELCARDIARGLPKSLSCGRWVHSGNGGEKVFVVDPLLSRLKHSGAEHRKLRGERWTAFCSEPRDPEIELRKIGEKPAPDEISRVSMGGLSPTIEAAIAAGIEAGLRAAGVNNGHAQTPPLRRREAKVSSLPASEVVTT